MACIRLKCKDLASPITAFSHQNCAAFAAGACGHGIFKDLPTNKMIRSYKGISPTVPPSCYVDESAQLIGDVVLGENASVWMNAVLRGDVHFIRVGTNSNIH